MRKDKWGHSPSREEEKKIEDKEEFRSKERAYFLRRWATRIPRQPRTSPYSNLSESYSNTCGHISRGNCWCIYCRLTKPCRKSFLESVGTKIEVELSAGRPVRTTHVGIRTIGRTVLSGTAFEVVFLVFYFVKFFRWGFKINRSFQRIRKNSYFYSS